MISDHPRVSTLTWGKLVHTHMIRQMLVDKSSNIQGMYKVQVCLYHPHVCADAQYIIIVLIVMQLENIYFKGRKRAHVSRRVCACSKMTHISVLI